MFINLLFYSTKYRHRDILGAGINRQKQKQHGTILCYGKNDTKSNIKTEVLSYIYIYRQSACKWQLN